MQPLDTVNTRKVKHKWICVLFCGLEFFHNFQTARCVFATLAVNGLNHSIQLYWNRWNGWKTTTLSPLSIFPENVC